MPIDWLPPEDEEEKKPLPPPEEEKPPAPYTPIPEEFWLTPESYLTFLQPFFQRRPQYPAAPLRLEALPIVETPEPAAPVTWPPAPPTWPEGRWEVPPMPLEVGLETARKGLQSLGARVEGAIERATVPALDLAIRALLAPPFPGWREEAAKIRQTFQAQYPLTPVAREFFERHATYAQPPWAARGVLGKKAWVMPTISGPEKAYVSVVPGEPENALAAFARLWWREQMSEKEQQAFQKLWSERPVEHLLEPTLRGYLQMREDPMSMAWYQPREKRLGPSPFRGTPLEFIERIPLLGVGTGVPGEALGECRYTYLVMSTGGDLRRLPSEYQPLYRWLEVLPLERFRAGLWPPRARR